MKQIKKSLLVLILAITSQTIYCDAFLSKIPFNESEQEAIEYAQTETDKIIDSITEQVKNYYTAKTKDQFLILQNIKNDLQKLKNNQLLLDQQYLLAQTLANFIESLVEDYVSTLLKNNNNTPAKNLFQEAINHIEKNILLAVLPKNDLLTQKVKKLLEQYLQSSLPNLLKPRTTMLNIKEKYKDIDLTLTKISDEKKNAVQKINQLTNRALNSSKQTSELLQHVLNNTKKEGEIIGKNYEQELINNFAESI